MDGPSGAGKSTLARRLAAELGYLYIDTGAMYRAAGLAARQAGVDLEDEAALAAFCQALEIRLENAAEGLRVYAQGQDVSREIRSPQASLDASAISAKEIVRRRLVSQQQQMGAAGGIVMDGRDIGTVVFPDAEVKLFVTASPEERARRRWQELQAAGRDVSFEQTFTELVERDTKDSSRDHSPLRVADDAVVIDTTDISIEDALAEALAVIASVSV